MTYQRKNRTFLIPFGMYGSISLMMIRAMKMNSNAANGESAAPMAQEYLARSSKP